MVGADRITSHPPLFFADNSKQLSLLDSNMADADGNTDLILEVKAGNIAKVDLLISSSTDLNHQNLRGVTALALAAQKGRVDCLISLIQAGAQVDLANHNGSTPLIQASHFGFSEIVDLLLQNHAHVDTRNNKGTTALMRAAQEGHKQVVFRLLQENCDVNARNEDGMNALMLGSQRGHAQIVDLLIQHNANIDGKTVQGSTALMLSCKRGHLEVVETLLSFGAELSVKDSKDRTAYDQASRRGQSKILEILTPFNQMMLMRKQSQTRRTYYLKKLFVLFQKNRASVNHFHLKHSPSMEALAWVLGCGTNDLFNQHQLPYAISLHICEYLPLPRLWENELIRIENRLNNASDVVVNGCLMMMNEIFNDFQTSSHFKNNFQFNHNHKFKNRLYGENDEEKGWLIHISKDIKLQEFLSNQFLYPLPFNVLKTLIEESDLESVLIRHRGITCDVSVAKKLLSLSKQVLAWYQWQDVPNLYQDPKLTYQLGINSLTGSMLKNDMDSAGEIDSDESDM